jgi:hypothetical protein
MDLKEREPDRVHQIQMAYSRIYRQDFVSKASNLQAAKVCFSTSNFMIFLNAMLLHGESGEQKSAYQEGFWYIDLVNNLL